jgi:hypothetical protein
MYASEERLGGIMLIRIGSYHVKGVGDQSKGVDGVA